MTTPLADLRKQFNLSRADLARKSGVGVYTIDSIERGYMRRRHPGTTRKIAEALGVHPGDIAEFARLNLIGDAPSQGPRSLREIRQQAYLSIADLAGRSGVPYNIIDAIELHKTTAPPWIIELLANALGLSSDDILEADLGQE